MKTVNLSSEQTRDVIDKLLGTFGNLDDALSEIAFINIENVSSASMDEISDEIFQCEECGFWYGWSDQSPVDGEICSNCGEYDEEGFGEIREIE